MSGADLQRCTWVGIEHPEYTRYHDEEWGVPQTDDVALLEKICLEGFQAGLSWLTILKKRPAFRQAFAGFDADRVARFGDADIARLLADPGIVRHRGKIEATIANSRAYLALRERMTLSAFLWGFLDGRPLIHQRVRSSEIPPQTELSKRISKALRAEGFRFVGPTTVYAFMQSSGFVNDHLVGCHRHGPCARLQRDLEVTVS